MSKRKQYYNNSNYNNSNYNNSNYNNSNYNNYTNSKSKTTLYYLKWSFAISIILSIISFCLIYNIGNLTLNTIINSYINWIYPFLIIPIIITVISFLSRCKKCKTCFSKSLIDDTCIDSYTTHETVNEQREVGEVVRRYHYKNGGNRITHSDQIFENITRDVPITHFRHKQTYRCKICGNLEIKYYETTKQ